jgi:hypothetical protein
VAAADKRRTKRTRGRERSKQAPGQQPDGRDQKARHRTRSNFMPDKNSRDPQIEAKRRL